MTNPTRQRAKDVTGIKVRIGEDHHDVPVVRRRRAKGNLKPMRFVSLHHHSTFSYMDGYQLPEAHVRRATELNMNAMVMTEHGNIDSHTRFATAAEEQGVKPIYGCEIYMNAGGDKEPTQRKFHLTVLAKTDEGYANLIALVTQSWRDFYYEATVTWESLLRHKRGLMILSGCQGSMLACNTVGGKGIDPANASLGHGLTVARAFKKEFGDNYAVEVQAFPELAKTCDFNKLAPTIAKKVGVRLVATMDCHYTLLEENEVQQILHNLRPGEKRSVEEMAREWGYDVPLCPPPNDRSIYRRLCSSGLDKRSAINAIVATEEIAQECNVTLPQLPMVRYPLAPGEDAIELWRKLLREGWRYRKFHRLPQAERKMAKAQLAHEMKLIESKDFVHYFLLVRAGVVHVKDQGIPVGPARGSAAASVAAYLLRITEVNPLDDDLLRFERFIDETREDLPDIDLDFPSAARPILRKFYEDMLGPGCVNNVGTFTYFRNKLALDDTARVFRVPKWEVDKIKDYLIERSSGDLRASSTILDTVAQFPAAAEVLERYPDLEKASLLEGNVKGFGVHAAALVLSNEPITSVTSVAEREVPKGSGNVVQVVALDKHDAERRGLVKMDFLGLNTMSQIWDAIRHPSIDMTIDELYGLPLDDQAVYDAFRANDVVGIFQFDGRAQRYVCGALKPDSFGELMDCNALSRPGPLHSGTTREYIEIKQGKLEPESLHPALDDITKATKFKIIYQEQILTILRVVGDFPWGVTAEVRKIISKKHGEQAFNRKRQQFLDGAAAIHERADVPPMSPELADVIWRKMITSGQYAFNAAHCRSYGLIGYWTMWFKVHHPAVFYATAMQHMKPKQKELLRDAYAEKVYRPPLEILPPDVRRSGVHWKAKGLKLRAGFSQVDGIGEKIAGTIVDERAPGWREWKDLTSVRGIGPKTVERVEAFVAKDDPWDVFLLDRNIKEVTRAIRDRELGNLPVPTHMGKDISDVQGDEVHVVWLGTIMNRNVRDLFEFHMSKQGEALDPATVKDPHLREWVVMMGEDETERVMLKIDRWRYPKFKAAVMGCTIGKDLLLVEGVRPRYASTRQVSVRDLWVIDPTDDEEE